jgi:hypothetical protein
MKASENIPRSAPPKKGSRKNPHFGASSTSNDET